MSPIKNTSKRPAVICRPLNPFSRPSWAEPAPPCANLGTRGRHPVAHSRCTPPKSGPSAHCPIIQARSALLGPLFQHWKPLPSAVSHPPLPCRIKLTLAISSTPLRIISGPRTPPRNRAWDAGPLVGTRTAERQVAHRITMWMPVAISGVALFRTGRKPSRFVSQRHRASAGSRTYRRSCEMPGT